MKECAAVVFINRCLKRMCTYVYKKSKLTSLFYFVHVKIVIVFIRLNYVVIFVVLGCCSPVTSKFPGLQWLLINYIVLGDEKASMTLFLKWADFQLYKVTNNIQDSFWPRLVAELISQCIYFGSDIV